MRGVRDEFDLKVVSANRVNSYTTCGLAFKREYIDREPVQRSGSAALFGSVIHKALETWSLDRTGDLIALVKEAWLTETGDDIAGKFLQAFAVMAPALQEAEAECIAAFEKRTKKPSKAIRMSGEWKKHPMSVRLDKFMADWNKPLERSFWRFNENDPLPNLYAESLTLAASYSARMKNAPTAWHTELGFKVPWRGMILNGYIDSLEPVVKDGEVVAIGIKDYKTYAREPAPMKDWRQRVMYHVAVTYLIAEKFPLVSDPEIPAEYHGLPVYVGMDYVRWAKDWSIPPVAWYTVTDVDYEALAEDLHNYELAVTGGIFLPAQKNQNPDWCNYPESCCLRCKPPGAGTKVDGL